jgi:TonB C terminal
MIATSRALDLKTSALLVVVAIGALVCSCVPITFEATTGRVYQEGSDPAGSAAIASASHDLPCDRPLIRVVSRDKYYTGGESYLVVPTVLEGCGQRVTYQVEHAALENDLAARYTLKSRTAAPAASAAVSAVPTNGSAADAGHLGDMYATKVAQFLRSRWTMPSAISKGEERNLCATFQVSVSSRMVIWHLKQEAIRKSGNDLFDESARETLQKLLDDRTPLPDPPDALADAFRGRTMNITMQGEGARCD